MIVLQWMWPKYSYRVFVLIHYHNYSLWSISCLEVHNHIYQKNISRCTAAHPTKPYHDYVIISPSLCVVCVQRSRGIHGVVLVKPYASHTHQSNVLSTSLSLGPNRSTWRNWLSWSNWITWKTSKFNPRNKQYKQTTVTQTNKQAKQIMNKQN